MTSDERIPEGTRVEVRSTLDSRWSSGFVVVEAGERGYRLRRDSDGAELPDWVEHDHVRRRRKRDTWWI